MEFDFVVEVRDAKAPCDYYVYLWFRNDDPLPFYIGCGMGKRAWARHMNSNRVGEMAYCEKLRSEAKIFRVDIARSGLSRGEAINLEITLIQKYRPIGNRAYNYR